MNNNLNQLRKDLADLNADINLKAFNLDVERSLCAICQELGKTTKDIISYKRCSDHQHTHFCNICRTLVTYSFICISCLSEDLK